MGTDSFDLKQKAVGWIIKRVLTLTNRRVDIRQLQDRHGAHEAKIVRMTLKDLGQDWHFRVKDGSLDLLTGPQKANGGFEATSDSLIALATGRRQMMNPGTGERFWHEYTPIDAITHGDLRVWGDAATNDALLFAKAIYTDVYPKLKEELAATTSRET